MQTGLNPIEHGYLGWNMYLSPIDETVELYTSINKETGKPSTKYHEVKKEYLSPKTIVDEINEQNKYHAISLFPFKDTKYKDLDEMISIIEKECQKEEKKYISFVPMERAVAKILEMIETTETGRLELMKE